ncbi:hypothetical protein [Tabrizicola sp.]|uniref:hypothetical protein n=1 Tax=Tabrizicola sp. TaxID=2005166 RepID=UPI0026319D82|nr:hypothetical protein [Tabrizicola sp.]MDM7930433.1 hypothetical protein [Tabrizicola sp.]
MKDSPNRRKPDEGKPKIWISGGQRPPFDLRAFGRASLHLTRSAVAPLLAWMAGGLRQAAVNIAAGSGRIPEARLGRAARFVPSHRRVAAWVQNLAATLAHASATADPDVKRGNTLVTRIEPYLWPEGVETPDRGSPIQAASETGTPPANPAPVVLAQPMQPGDDPLRGIRDDLEDGKSATAGPPVDAPPAPPGPVATTAIQVSGYLFGWAAILIALPFGLGHAGWKHIKGEDLRKIGAGD